MSLFCIVKMKRQQSVIINLENKLTEIIKIVENNKKSNINLSILTGKISRFLLLGNFYNFKREKKKLIDLKKEIKIEIEQLIKIINDNKVENSYINGLVGFAYCLTLFVDLDFFYPEDEDFFEDLDEFTWELAKVYIKENNYDLFYGLIGVGNYYVLRCKRKPILKERLQSIGDALLDNYKSCINKSEIDFSLSHGVSSILIFLAKLVTLSISENNYRKEILDISFYILTYKKDTRLPDIVVDNEAKYCSVRWCHGDLGIVYVLGYVSKVIDNEEINKSALQIAIKLTEQNGHIDQELFSATICHGTIGVAHIFNKMYRNIWKHPKLKDGANYWYNISNEIMNSDCGYNYNDENNNQIELDGILNGKEGIGLAILSALNDKNNLWDNSILLYD